jgi:hypothetical protein
LGYLLVGVSLILGGLAPETLVGLPGPGGYSLTDYEVIPYVPVVPLAGLLLGAVTVWSVNRSSKAQSSTALLSSGYLLTVAFLWVQIAEPGTSVRGLGFPVSWIMLLALPRQPLEFLGTSLVSFALDWSLWTIFIDSLLIPIGRSRLRRPSDQSQGSR